MRFSTTQPHSDPRRRTAAWLLRSIAALAIASLGLSHTLLSAQAPFPVLRSGAAIGTLTKAGAATAVVIGTVVTADESPIANAHVRLRSLESGLIVGATTTDDAGTFSQLVPEAGEYVAEVIDESDRVIADSDALSVVEGQPTSTIIVIAHQSRLLASFWKYAAAIMAAAAGTGVTALAPGDPVSPER